MFKWNYEQHLYTHTLIPIINRFASTNEPLSTKWNIWKPDTAIIALSRYRLVHNAITRQRDKTQVDNAITRQRDKTQVDNATTR